MLGATATAPISSPAPDKPSSAPAPGAAPPAQPSAPDGIGGIGGTTQPANDLSKPTQAEQIQFDKWRELIAGGDEKTLSEVSRFKSPGDIGKELLRQKQELSKRVEGGVFPEKGTPEQQTAWRKANGVPDAGTLEAYGIKTPDGYEMSNVEKAALGELATRLHGKNVPGQVMAEITDTFFRAQTANQQMLNEMDLGKNKEGRSAFDKEHGKDAEPYLAVANAAFEKAVPDEQVRMAIMNARLPGGGRLGSHPGFMNLMVEYGLKAGFGDRIEASTLESGGRSLAMRQAELEGLRTKDAVRYNDPKTQEELRKIITLRQNRGEIDEFGEERKRR